MGQAPERRNTWLVPTIVGLAIVVAVGAVVFMLVRGVGEEPTAAPTGPAATSPADGSATEAGGGATPDPEATAAPVDDDRVVASEPLEPRVDTEIVGTDFALSDAGWAEHGAGVQAGAREAIAGTYTDGSVDVPVTAAAFGTIAEQDAYSEQLAADLEDNGGQLMSEGTVYPDSTGRHWAFMLADGVTTSVVWRTDDGVVLTLTGDAEAVPDIYANMLI